MERAPLPDAPKPEAPAPADPSKHPDGARPVESWIDALAGEEGPATRERKRLHLRAMVAGAGAHPDLRWSRGEMLTREAFLDGIAKIEGHRP